MFGDGAEVPDYGIYEKMDWPNQDKGQAAMITRMDKGVGRILDHLKKLKIADKTLVLFTSDNGPHNEARHNPERFNPSGPLRGAKRAPLPRRHPGAHHRLVAQNRDSGIPMRPTPLFW